ncbi:hypothetical protein F4861DRAFT_210089 [Xylaria intraflava]|nr:hypothetical protein F4861DRAFT_210089 [Xylaria intraflava]
MANPVQNPQNRGPADQYLQLNSELPVPRPAINVPNDLSYSIQRYANSHAHTEDRHLRPPAQFSTPLTEEQSCARMAAILAAATEKIQAPA